MSGRREWGRKRGKKERWGQEEASTHTYGARETAREITAHFRSGQ